MSQEEQNKKYRVVGEELPGDESNAIIHLMNSTIKVRTAVGEAHARRDEERAQIELGLGEHEPSLYTRVATKALEKQKKKQSKKKKKQSDKQAKHHSRKKIAIFHYSHYDIAFKFLVEQVFDAEWVNVPARTKRTLEMGARYSSDTVCAPFKHILGDYIEALELGADVLVQMAGPCRLGYYGELHESILRDLGYEFEVINFSYLTGVKGYIEDVERINPNLNIPNAINKLMTVAKMIDDLDEAYDYYLAHAGFEVEEGSFDRVLKSYYHEMSTVTDDTSLAAAQLKCMDSFRSLKTNKPQNPVKVGIVGEFFTAVDQHSNLQLEHKLLKMGVEIHRQINLSNRYLHYSEPNLRVGVSEYIAYDMGPTSTMTIAAAKRYAEDDFDGLIHMKSSGCTPEIDCIPVLQEIGRDYKIPVLYLSFDSQTSDAGLDTRIEAFYDMLAMKKERSLS